MFTTATGLGGSLRQPFVAPRPRSSFSSPDTCKGFALEEIEGGLHCEGSLRDAWPGPSGTKTAPTKAFNSSRVASAGRHHVPPKKSPTPAASEITSFALDLNGSKKTLKQYPYWG